MVNGLKENEKWDLPFLFFNFVGECLVNVADDELLYTRIPSSDTRSGVMISRDVFTHVGSVGEGGLGTGSLTTGTSTLLLVNTPRRGVVRSRFPIVDPGAFVMLQKMVQK